MKTNKFGKPGLILILFFIYCMYLPGFSQTKSGDNPRADLLKLEYRYQTVNPVKYQVVSKITQTMDIQGQAMQNYINSIFGCTVKAIGKPDSNLKLEITADTLVQSVESPMGVSGGSVQEVNGKVFSIVITPDGKETDISEAEKIAFDIEGSGSSNLAQEFLEFFPLLPVNRVKPGDMWNIVDSVRGETTAVVTKSRINSAEKLEGIETIGGVECARITSVLTGTMEITTSNQGMEIIMKGTVTGTGTLLFAIKEGYFVNQTVNSKVTGSLEISSPESMSFPMVMDVNSVSEVIR